MTKAPHLEMRWGEVSSGVRQGPNVKSETLGLSTSGEERPEGDQGAPDSEDEQESADDGVHGQPLEGGGSRRGGAGMRTWTRGGCTQTWAQYQHSCG